ncbi:glycosyltransferase family 2 protein [Pelagicoccus albus]|uniref:Glycosyltransferase n=1 Tax=Pelagicoccus albus TaxID=415222 RepID=A0A7X1B5Z7_9BACT|nr:glycosyltransferase [Pelagicoccus albus]MBC2606266.1 glycosyltransferase [Pelagicoccus albus]
MITIVVGNYNNERYIAETIDSVLPLAKRGVEIVVVDDGSTDRSREILKGYEDEIKVVLKENGGQLSAYRAGFCASTKDWILFLDGDDALDLEKLVEQFSLLKEGVSKLQYCLRVIDGNGEVKEGRVPSMRMGCMDEKRSLELYGEYASPPGSGAIYSRAFIAEVIEPLSRYNKIVAAADALLYSLAPYYGKVVSVDEEVGFYRKHSAGACGWVESTNPKEILKDARRQYFNEKRFVWNRNQACRKAAKELGIDFRVARSRMVSELKVLAALSGVRGYRHYRRILGRMVFVALKCPGYSLKIRMQSVVWSSLFAFPFGNRYKLFLGSKVFR